MSTKTIAEPGMLLRPSDDGRRTKLRKSVAITVLGVTAVSGLAFGVSANSTRTPLGPVPALFDPANPPLSPHGPMVVAGCLADIECYGESQLILNQPAPQ